MLVSQDECELKHEDIHLIKVFDKQHWLNKAEKNKRKNCSFAKHSLRITQNI